MIFFSAIISTGPSTSTNQYNVQFTTITTNLKNVLSPCDLKFKINEKAKHKKPNCTTYHPDGTLCGYIAYT